MKKIISVFFAALLFVSALMLSSCGNTDGEKDFGDAVTLYVYNWGEYISDGSEGTLDVNAAFEALTGITVTSSSPRASAKFSISFLISSKRS